VKLYKYFVLTCALFLFFSCLPSLAQVTLKTSGAGFFAKQYLPGDFIHIVVQAPVDTAQITAVLPDGKALSLVQERRSNLWHGMWEVPLNFKKGFYSAKLSAVDFDGNVFEGNTDSFTIGELSLITLIEKPTHEALFEQMITAEAPPVSAEAGKFIVSEKELIKTIKELIQGPTTPTPEIQPEERDKLVKQNLEAGTASLTRGALSEAAAYFRVVLFLKPDNLEAGQYLVSIKEQQAVNQKQQKKQLFYFLIPISATGFLAVILVLYLISKILRPRVIPKPSEKPEPEISPAEKRKIWFNKAGWTRDPFSPEEFKQLSIEDRNLEFEGLKNFIKARIHSAGGRETEPFSHSALEEIYRLTKGKPSSAMKLCAWTVSQAILHNQDQISAELVVGYETIAYNRILIADDEEVVLNSLDLVLRRGGGYETDFARDGEEALQKVKENIYGLLLLDIAMPKIDGYQVLKEVRTMHPDLPVIFVSGRGESKRIMESLAKYDLTGLIEKPFTPEKVLNIVATTLKTKKH